MHRCAPAGNALRRQVGFRCSCRCALGYKTCSPLTTPPEHLFGAHSPFCHLCLPVACSTTGFGWGQQSHSGAVSFYPLFDAKAGASGDGVGAAAIGCLTVRHGTEPSPK